MLTSVTKCRSPGLVLPQTRVLFTLNLSGLFGVEHQRSCLKHRYMRFRFEDSFLFLFWNDG